MHIVSLVGQAESISIDHTHYCACNGPLCACTATVDHRSEDCTFKYQLQTSRPPSSSPSASHDWLHTQGRPTHSTLSSSAPLPGFSHRAICSSQNKGRCVFPGTCNFLCILCLRNHQARSCSHSRQGLSPETTRLPVIMSLSVHS